MIEIKPEWIAEYFLDANNHRRTFPGAHTHVFSFACHQTTLGDISIGGNLSPSHLAKFLNEKTREEKG